MTERTRVESGLMPKSFKNADMKRAKAAARASLEAWQAADDIHAGGFAKEPLGQALIEAFKKIEDKKREEAMWLLSLYHEPPRPIRFVMLRDKRA